MEDPKRTPGVALLLCVCSSSALFRDQLEASRSVEHDFLSIS